MANFYANILDFGNTLDSADFGLRYMHSYLRTFSDLPLDEGLHKSLIFKVTVSSLSADEDIQLIISDFEDAYRAGRATSAGPLYEDVEDASYTLTSVEQRLAEWDARYELRKRQRRNEKRRRAARKVSKGYPARHGKPSLSRASNTAIREWRDANWLNVTLGAPKVAVRNIGKGLKRADRKVTRAIVSRIFANYNETATVRAVVKRIFNKVRSEAEFQSTRDLPSDAISRAERRHLREVMQRRCARERELKAFKEAHSKDERERLIKSQRDKRDGAISLHEQSGRIVHVRSEVLATRAVIFVLSSILGGVVTRAAHKTGKASDSFIALASALQNLADGLRRHLGAVLWAVPFAVIASKFASTKGIRRHLLYVPFVALLAKMFGPKLWKHISEFFQGGGDAGVPEFQSGGTDVFAKILSVTMVASVFRGKFTKHTLTEVMKRVSMVERTSSGWDSLLKWTFSAVESVVNFLRNIFGKERISLFRNAHGPATDWFKAVDDACQKHDTASVDVDAAELDRLVSLVMEGNKFKDLYRSTDMERPVALQLAKIVNLLQPHLGALAARNNFRMEPVACMFLGDPGIGKTRMAPAICAAVLLGSGLVPPGTSHEKVAAEIFQKGISEYWNGYSKQKCLVMDDAFQPRANLSDRENEYMTLIRMVCPWSFPLNFADLASKGKIFFDSKFIFGTTNVACIHDDAMKVIHEPSAVTRRIHYGYKVELKPEYKDPLTGRLSDSAYKREVTACIGQVGYKAYPFYMWQVRKHDFLSGKTDSVAVELSELVSTMAMDLRVRVAQHESAKDEFSNLVGGFAAPAASPAAFTSEPANSEFTFAPQKETWSDIPLCEEQGLRRFLVSAGQSVHAAFKRSNARLEKKWVYTELDEFDKMYRQYIYSTKPVAIWLDIAVNVLYVALGAFALRTFIYTLLKGVTALLSAVFGPMDYGDEQSNRPPSLAQKGWRKAASGRVKLRKPKEEKTSVEPQSVDTTVATNVYANTYKAYVELRSGAKQVLGQIMFLTDTLAVQPAHFTRNIRELLDDGSLLGESKMFLRNAQNAQHTLTISVSQYLAFQRDLRLEHDVEFIKFLDIRAHRNIVKSFVTEKDLSYVGGTVMRLDVCEIDNRQAVCNENRRQTYIFKNVRLGKDLGVRDRTVSRYIRYDACTTQGDCGAPLCLFDASSYSGRTCVGFHVAGNSAHALGFSTIVTQEMIAGAIKTLSAIDDKFEADLTSRADYQSGGELPFEEPGSFLAIGKVAKPVNLCPKTSYYMVEGMYGSLGEYDYLPAPLSSVYRDGVLVHPMDNAVRPYSTPVLIYDQPWLDNAVHQAFVPLTMHTAGCSRRIYTFDEAVVGVPEEKFRSIPRGTAAGFPYVYDVRDGKKEFFGAEGDYDLTTPRCAELRERVEHILECARSGQRLAHVFVDFLKDELRSREKVEKVATRLISSAPLDYVVAWRRMFGAFSAAVMRNHTVIGMAPGICAYTDWDVLACQLQARGDKVFDGDFKAFDSSEQPTIHRLILKHINAWYDDGPENARVREVLWLDLCHSRHIGGRGTDQRYIYQWNKSLPSGHPFTTIVNSLYSLVTLVATYIAATGDMVGFWRNVSPVTYGDDNVVNVTDSISDVYNQREVARHMQEQFGLTYTPGRKDGVWEPVTTLNRVTFLKRGFRRHNNEWLCPLELDSFLFTHYWCKNRKLERRIMRDVLDGALQELSMHDATVWDSYARKIYGLLQRYVDSVELGPSASCEQSAYLTVVHSRSDSWY